MTSVCCIIPLLYLIEHGKGGGMVSVATTIFFSSAVIYLQVLLSSGKSRGKSCKCVSSVWGCKVRILFAALDLLVRRGDRLLWVPRTPLKEGKRIAVPPVETQMKRVKVPQCHSPLLLINHTTLPPSPLTRNYLPPCKLMDSRLNHLQNKIVFSMSSEPDRFNPAACT